MTIPEFYGTYRNVYRNSPANIRAQSVHIFEEILFYCSYAEYTWITPQSCRDNKKV